MIIVNADDYGSSPLATERILACHAAARITDASAMVFMADSERAAGLARAAGLPTGLHFNLTQPFTHGLLPARLAESHERVAHFLNRSRYASLIYHPGLAGRFEYLFRHQLDEYQRLYGAAPSHIDGHHHMHLSANMLLGGVIPRGQKVRRNFSFAPGEKSRLNRTYRALVDRWLARRFVIPDYLFDLPGCLAPDRLPRVLGRARRACVELETHPELTPEFEWLMSDEWASALAGVPRGNYDSLCDRVHLHN